MGSLRLHLQVFDLHGKQLRRVRRFSIGRGGMCLKAFGLLFCLWFRKESSR